MTRLMMALLLAGSMFVAACGSRSDEEGGGDGGDAGGVDNAAGDGGSEAAASDPGVSDTEIKVGASLTLSGPVAFLGEEVLAGIDSYFQMVNDRGGINGRKLKLVTYDDRLDPTQLLANLRKLVEQDEVVALVTFVGDSAFDYISRQGTPTITFGVTPAAFASNYPTVYPVVGNALLWTQEAIAGLQENGVIEEGTKVGIIYDTTAFDVSPYLDEIKESWENVGAEVVSTDPYTLETGSCDSLVVKYRDLGVQYWDFQSAAWFLCVESAQRQGWTPEQGWGNWPSSVPALATLAGPSVDGVWGGSNGDQPDGAPRKHTAAHDEFTSAVKKYYPDQATSEHFDSPALIGYWAGAKLIVDALEAQGDAITADGINEWMQDLEDYEIGITPPIVSMAPDCKTGSEAVWIGQWKWDPKTQSASRKPQGGYFTSPQKEKFGGKCFLTKLSDEIIE
ncbi:MAG TPA: ABC transporter substrate-binding protein [Acidimicrobiales bacterium]|nr:ABC transporter substrate-binding protein [Acidimicrobiales bacterium]